MKSKTEAAKVLLEAGWTAEEVFGVLFGTQQRQSIDLRDKEYERMKQEAIDKAIDRLIDPNWKPSSVLTSVNEGDLKVIKDSSKSVEITEEIHENDSM